MFKNLKSNSLFKKILICCSLVVFIVGVSHVIHAQDDLEIKSMVDAELQTLVQADQLVSIRKMMGTIVHAGAVQIGRSTDDVCLSTVKADTFLTIVNPSASLLVTCSTVPIHYFTIYGKVVLYDTDGSYAGHTTFKVPPKGNKTVSLARILLANNVDTVSHIKKYTYDIVWYVPQLISYLEKTRCRVPFIPISVEVKEIIFKNWLCLSSYLYNAAGQAMDDQDILLYRHLGDSILAMSETILDKSNIIYPVLSAIATADVAVSDTVVSNVKPVEVVTSPQTVPSVSTAVRPTTSWTLPTPAQNLQTPSILPSWNTNTNNLFTNRFIF